MKSSPTKARPAEPKPSKIRPRVNEVPRTAVVTASGPKWWYYALGFLGALVSAFIVYSPAMNGPFVLDDTYLPFMSPAAATLPPRLWLAVRPLLMATYWFNYATAGVEPYWYHWVNVVLHAANSLLIYAILKRLLEWAGAKGSRCEMLAMFGGALFLAHPVQTESVSYVASRSENLSVLFLLAAFGLFLYRRKEAVSVPITAGILLLFGAAALTKEHTVVLPLLLLLTDYYFNPGFSFSGIKRNWKLYAPICVGGIAAAAWVIRTLSRSTSAGFAVKDVPWYEYLFTQFRAIWLYLRLYLLPFGLNLDYDFPVSRTIFDHGAVLYAAGLLALAVGAWIYRRRFPLASYGYFAFLLLLAPTSSIVPVKDMVFEHRLYLPFIGLLLITVDLLRRWKAPATNFAVTLGAIVLVMAVLAYNRNAVWANSVSLWQDTAAKSPNKARPRFQLAYAYWQAGRCVEAASEYASVAKLQTPDARLLTDWALAEDCAGSPAKAVEKFQSAATLEPTAEVYSMIGMEYSKQGRTNDALAAFDRAQQLNPQLAVTYVNRGNLYASTNDFMHAKEQYEKALAIDPSLQAARNNLAIANQHLPDQPR